MVVRLLGAAGLGAELLQAALHHLPARAHQLAALGVCIDREGHGSRPGQFKA